MENVKYCSNSDYQYSQLNEEKYLDEIFRSLEAEMQDFHDYEFHVFASHNTVGVPDLVNSNHPKKILIWLSEEQGFLPPKVVLDSYIAIFKTSYSTEFLKSKKLHGLPLGCTKHMPQLPVKPMEERSVNAFFCGQMSMCRMKFYYQMLFGKFTPLIYNSVTQRFMDYIYKRFLTRCGKKDFGASFGEHSLVRFTDGFQKGLKPEEYAKVLQDSKIVLSPKGFYNTECYRTYEALRAGCVVISETLPDVPFYTGSPVINVDGWTEVNNIVAGLLEDSEKMKSLSLAGKKWYDDHLSGQGTARYIISELSKI